VSGGGGPPALIRRHPSEATLVAHAAGTLWVAAKPVVQGHLDLCEHCRVAFGLAEAVGGALLDELPPAPLSLDALRRVTERLGGRAGTPAQPAASPDPAAVVEQAATPSPGLRDARLRWLVPGVRHAVLLRGPTEGTLRMLRVRPGTALPRHAHRGTELTLVLEGAFSDETGRHGPGDLVEVEGEESHRPVAEGTADCVCLIATEGRLRFGGLLGALFGAVARV
jgi:putative transcriptional regulator